MHPISNLSSFRKADFSNKPEIRFLRHLIFLIVNNHVKYCYLICYAIQVVYDPAKVIKI